MSATLPDALADALARVISDVRREARIDLERIQAEHRAELAEFRAQMAERIAATKACVDGEVGRIREALARVRDGRDGRDADPDYMRELAAAEVVKAMADWPVPERGEKGEPGKDADEDLIVEKVLARTPRPEKGDQGEPGRDGVDGQKGDTGPQGEPGRDGQDAVVDQELIAWIVDEAVEKSLPPIVERAIAALPVPKDGRDGVDGKDGAPGLEGVPGRDGIDGKPGEKGDPGQDGKDGVGMAGLVIDRAGCCIATMTDGTVRELGPIVGRDGAPGERGADGRDGRDGIDGLSIEDLSAEFDGERMLTLRFVRGAIVKEIPVHLAIPIDRGVYKTGGQYERGDAVSFGGSLWIAQKQTHEKPGNGDGAWRLAVKHGRDGRDGKDGATGERGPEGRAGRDFTLGSQK